MRLFALGSALVLLSFPCAPSSSSGSPATSASAAAVHPPTLDFGVRGMVYGARTFPLTYGGASYTPDGFQIVLSSAPFDCKFGRAISPSPSTVAGANVQMTFRIGPDGKLFPGQTVAMPYFTEDSPPRTDAGATSDIDGLMTRGTITLEPLELATATSVRGTVHAVTGEERWKAGNTVHVLEGTFDVAVCPGGVTPTVKPEPAAAACATPELHLAVTGKPDRVIPTAIAHALDDGTFGDVDLFDHPVTCTDLATHSPTRGQAIGSMLIPRAAEHLLGKAQPAEVSVDGMQADRASWVQLDKVDVPGGKALGCAYGLDAKGTKVSGHFEVIVCPRTPVQGQ